MTDAELIEQFRRCEQWQDAEQWDLLGVAYYQRGCDLNALFCFHQADALREPVAIEMEVAARNLHSRSPR